MTESAAGRLIRNALYNNASWAVTFVCALLLTPLLIRHLGIEGYGVYALLASWVGYVNVIDFGLGQGLVRFVAQYEALGRRAVVERSIRWVVLFHLFVGCVGAALIEVYADPALVLLRVPELLRPEAQSAIDAGALGFIFTMLHAALSAALTGLQRYDLTSRVSVVATLGLSAAIGSLVIGGAGLREIVFVSAAAPIVSAIASAYLLRRQLRSASVASDAASSPPIGQLFSFSGYVFVTQLASFVVQHGMRFILSFFLGPASVTLYVVPMKIISLLGGVLGPAFGVLFPYATELHVKDDQRRIQRLFVEGSRIYASLLLPFMLLFVFSARPMLQLWLGAEFANQGWQMFALLALFYGVGWLSTVPSMLMLSLGYARDRCLFSVASLCAYLGLALTLIPRLGALGAAATLSATAITGQAIVIFATTRIMKLELRPYYREVLSVHLIPAVAAALLVWPFCRQDGSSEVVWLLCAGAWLGAYFVMMARRGVLPVATIVRHLGLRWGMSTRGATGV